MRRPSRRRFHGLRGELVEHYIEIPDLAQEATKSFRNAEVSASGMSPTPASCHTATRQLAAGVSKLAMARCLAQESYASSTRRDAEIEEIQMFLPPTNLDAVVDIARDAKAAIERCYDRAGAVAAFVPSPQEPFRPLPDAGGGLVEF